MHLHCKLTAPDPARAAAALQGLPGVLELRPRPGALHIHYNPRQVRYRELARCLESGREIGREIGKKSGGPHAPHRSLRGWLRHCLYEWLEQNFLEQASQPPNWEAALRDTYLRLKLLHPRTPAMKRAPSLPSSRIDETQAQGDARSSVTTL